MDGGFREWLAGLTRREALLLTIAGLAVLGGGGLWYARSLPQPVRIRAPTPAPTISAAPSTVLVHVAGWVRRPGVYELHEGDRVVDAIQAAGGARRGADLGALNLAAVLVDAQQVLVPKTGEAQPAAGTVPGSEAPQQLVNVNTASPTELEELPGIGPVLAEAIVSYREEHGPFTSVDQLEDVSGIGPVTLGEIRDLVTV
ncbi:MAG: helix-hairpin-helix domain-containing protein [Actinomycetota bacterium]